MDHSPALTLLGSLGADATYEDAEACFRGAGWDSCGAGDWAIALASSTADIVVRISPFDPVGPYTARLYREAAATDQVPVLHAHRRLAGGGDLQLLERLTPVDESEAHELLDRFAMPTAEFSALAAIVGRIHADALRELPWCGPLDSNPSNVMRTLAGRLVLTDPYYADGPDLYATAVQDPALLVARIPEAERRFLTRIPLASSGPWSAEDRETVREAVRRADHAAATRVTG